MHVETKYGSGLTPYYNTIINSTVDMCKFFNGTGNNLIAKWIIDAVSDSLPEGLLHPCPFNGAFKSHNITFQPTEVILQFLKGSYRNIITFKFNLDVS
jgi:hypothetical protein